MKTDGNSIAYDIKKLFFPHICPGCRRATDDFLLCPECRLKWEEEKGKVCRKCKKSARLCECTLCPEGEKYSFRLLRLTDYAPESVTSALIYRIKNKRSPRTAAFLARELDSLARERKVRGGNNENGNDDDAPVITYAPRNARTARSKGIDQAKELAQEFAALRSLSVTGTVERLASGEQKALAAAERVSAAYRTYKLVPGCEEKICGKRVIVIDDIVTTGATMCEIGTLLREAGAKEVICLCVARTGK